MGKVDSREDNFLKAHSIGIFYLFHLARAAITRWRATAADRGLALEYHRFGDLAPVWAARRDAERALDMLIENAVNYSPAQNAVTIVAASGRIEVRDRGPGVGDDERDVVFDRFHRGRAGLVGPPGSGLGLAIARELARGWGGEVVIEQRPGGGSVAILSLPDEAQALAALPVLNPTVGTLP